MKNLFTIWGGVLIGIILGLAFPFIFSPGELYAANYPASELNTRLGGISFVKAETGMKLPLHCLIEVNPSIENNNHSELSVFFERKYLTKVFIKKVFYEKDENILTVHPFTSRGIEAILTKDGLKLIIHDGVILHLRNNIFFFDSFKTFNSTDISGEILKVKGNVQVSFDTELVKKEFSNIWIEYHGSPTPCIEGENCFKQKDGSHIIIGPVEDIDQLYQKYAPKVVE